MKLPLYQVDAFTNRVFGGNPAAVVLLDEWLPDRTPAAMEVDLCGHATLASAHVLFRHSFPAAKRLRFRTRSGELAVTRDGEVLSMDFPARPGRPVEVTEAMVSALGVRPREAYLARDLLVVLGSEREIANFEPDFQRIASLDAFGVIISAAGDNADYVYRFFAPRQGIPEDPVTGSANCTLVPYWSARLGKADLVAKQLSARGGDLRCGLRGERVLIAGHAVEYLHGEITITTTP